MARFALLMVLGLFSEAWAQIPVCVPPQEPWVPISDADLRAYANLVAGDFEPYFSALTRHFQCLEAAWQDGIERGQAVEAERKVFMARARTFGMDDRIGIDPAMPPEVPE